MVLKNKLNKKSIFKIIGLTVFILIVAYPAFSHDFFNYMFDARIVTKYHLNPYQYKALDFPNDLWIRFMHWTHRTYPYGPVWLLLTLPFSLFGYGKFVITLLNFKLMFSLFHVGNCWLIYKILSVSDEEKALMGLSFYAFNPLILIESLVNGHNEVMMLFFLLLSIYMLIKSKSQVAVFISLLLSAGIKFVTIVALPVLVFLRSTAKKNNQLLVWTVFIILIPVLILEIFYREAYPWYFIPFIGLTALLVRYKNLHIFMTGLSVAALLRYAPFFYSGDYSPEMIQIRELIFMGTVAISAIMVVVNIIRYKYIIRV